MKKFMKNVGMFLAVVILIVALLLGPRFFPDTKAVDKTMETVRQELIKELDTNKKMVIFEFEKFTDTIEEEQKILEAFIDDGLDRNYIISTIEIVEGRDALDRTILIFENGY